MRSGEPELETKGGRDAAYVRNRGEAKRATKREAYVKRSDSMDVS